MLVPTLLVEKQMLQNTDIWQKNSLLVDSIDIVLKTEGEREETFTDRALHVLDCLTWVCHLLKAKKLECFK